MSRTLSSKLASPNSFNISNIAYDNVRVAIFSQDTSFFYGQTFSNKINPCYFLYRVRNHLTINIFYACSSVMNWICSNVKSQLKVPFYPQSNVIWSCRPLVHKRILQCIRQLLSLILIMTRGHNSFQIICLVNCSISIMSWIRTLRTYAHEVDSINTASST